MKLFNDTLGLLDLFGGLLMLWSAYKITTRAGFDTAQARWALIRRIIYWVLTFDLISFGLLRLSDKFPTENPLYFSLQSVLLCGIIFFPCMRALGLISQDFLTGRPILNLFGPEHHNLDWKDRIQALYMQAHDLRTKAQTVNDRSARATMLAAATVCERTATKLYEMVKT